MRHPIAIGICVCMLVLSSCAKQEDKEGGAGIQNKSLTSQDSILKRHNNYSGFWENSVSTKPYDVMSAARNRRNPDCVDIHMGGLEVGNDTVGKLFKLYGRSENLAEDNSDKAYCYYSPAENVTLLYDVQNARPEELSDALIVAVNISRVHRNKCKVMKTNNTTFITGKGIKLGDSLGKIVKMFGKPDLRESYEANTAKLHYHSIEGTGVVLNYDASYLFKDDKLIEISVYNGVE